MRPWIAAAAVALLAVGLAGWRLTPVSPPGAAPAPRRPTVAVVSDLAPGAEKSRVLLTRAQIDQAIASGTIDRPVKSLLKVEGPLRFGEFSWDDRGIPPGPLWIRVDLGSQLMSVFRSGHEIGTAVIVYGGDNKETPSGTLHILARDKDHYSSLYDAAMPYTLQLTMDGVAIHGSNVRRGAATHGCIGVPLEFARRLFDQARVGDDVVVVPPSPGRAARRTS